MRITAGSLGGLNEQVCERDAADRLDRLQLIMKHAKAPRLALAFDTVRLQFRLDRLRCSVGQLAIRK
jgi:hypothetical protein